MNNADLMNKVFKKFANFSLREPAPKVRPPEPKADLFEKCRVAGMDLWEVANFKLAGGFVLYEEATAQTPEAAKKARVYLWETMVAPNLSAIDLALDVLELLLKSAGRKQMGPLTRMRNETEPLKELMKDSLGQFSENRILQLADEAGAGPKGAVGRLVDYLNTVLLDLFDISQDGRADLIVSMLDNYGVKNRPERDSIRRTIAPGRYSKRIEKIENSQLKVKAYVRLRQGESLEKVSRDLGVTAAKLLELLDIDKMADTEPVGLGDEKGLDSEEEGNIT